MRSDRGFTLIELLIVVAIIGIIAAIAIPNLLNAINRGRQKRTMADMRSIAVAIETYSVDLGFYPKIGTNRDMLETYLSPSFLKEMPDVDGWRNAFRFAIDTTSGRDYTITSNGRDSLPATLVYGTTGSFDCDIVYTNGYFYTWPEGVQVD
jgi:general secretion pathway protein G